jgi:SagB-type dehydrogenase family enzyme
MVNREPGRILRYHDATRHSPASVRQGRHGLDWDIQPRPFKVYPDLDPIPLPRDFPSSTRPALAVLDGPRGHGGPPLDRAQLARLLYFTAGVLRRRAYPGGEICFRAAACTGALYHIDVYLVCGILADLEPGVYHFAPDDFALRRLRAGDHRATLAGASGEEPAVAGAPAILVCTSTFWRNAWKYQARAYRHCFWDGGTLLANLLAVAAAIDLPARVVAGFADEAVNALLDLDTAREVALCLVPLGRDAAHAGPAPAHPALGLATLPPSSREIDYPAIREAHGASSLASGEEAAAWRTPIPARIALPARSDVIAPLHPHATDAVAAPIEEVIRRRGSTREFARAAIRHEDLSTVLWAASRPLDADWLGPSPALTDMYVIVNEVDGLAPGTYAFDRGQAALVPLRQASLRSQAGFLALGQSLAADAAACVYWLADLPPLLAHFGNRGYRAAQLEAAIAGGRTYLAAYALGLGATGLTFFDDEVTAFFSPHAARRSVMFLMAFGHPAHRGGGGR